MILWGLAYLTDCIISQGIRKTDIREFQAWNDIYSSNIKGDVVISGNSRAWCQYSPQILDSITGLNFYNLGIDGHPINYQIIRYNTYRRFNHKPKYIIQNIDFMTFSISHTEYEKEQFLPFIFDDTLMNEVKEDMKINWIELKIPLIRYFGYHEIFKNGFKSFFGENKFVDGGLNKGYRGNKIAWNGAEFNKTKVIFYAKDPVALKLFSSYLAKSKKEGIKVILVSAPLYFEAARKIKDLKGLNAMFIYLARKYDLKLLDYMNDSISYDRSNFYNAMHLNKKGAELFSSKLANDLKSLNIVN